MTDKDWHAFLWRLARFAAADSQETFSIVELTSGEEGLFQQLATGSLRRGDPLTKVNRLPQ
jgi:hypothetical protein